MATSPSHRAQPHRAARAKSKSSRAKPVKTHRAAAKHSVGLAATAVLKSFVKLLGSLRNSAAHLTDEQRVKLKKAMKHAHAALD